MSVEFTTKPVLIVEDEQVILESLTVVMKADGFAVIEAQHGDIAVGLVGLRPISALVVDINIPGNFDGLEVAKLARKQNPTLPVVFASVRADNWAVAHSIYSDFDPPVATVVKPFDPRIIPALVRRLLSEQAMWATP